MRKHPLLRTLSYLRKYWLPTIAALLCLLLVTAANLLFPDLIGMIIDRGIGDRDRTFLIWAALGLVALAALRGLFSFLQGYLSEYTSQGVAYDLRNELYAKIQSLSFSYHDRAQTGQLMTRATNDVEVVRMFSGFALINLLNSLIMLLGAAIILLSIHSRLAVLSLSTLPLMVLAITKFGRTIRSLFGQVQRALDKLNTLLQENLAGIRVVKAFAREEHEIARFTAQNQQLLMRQLRVSRAFSTYFPLFHIIASLGTIAVLLYGGNQVMAQQLTLGELVAFNTYLLMLSMPVRRLGFLINMGARASTSARRIFEILDVPSEIRDKPGAIPLPPIRGDVCFEHVTFRYIEGQDVLHDVSFKAEAGQTVALLGETGSGKSTIINLIPRFYDVSEGRVTIDGYDVRDVTLESLRRQIGIVLQETTLFSGTIGENIAYGSPNASMKEIVEVAKAARAHDFITAFPQGYDTEVGERGVRLSGGQKQRIAIARALLLNPRILILDDFTSNVDFETEYLIQEALTMLMKGRTSFVIAQRVGTVQRADLILVLDKGRIVARGKHEELIQESGIYAEIYELQLGGRSNLWLDQGEPSVEIQGTLRK